MTPRWLTPGSMWFRKVIDELNPSGERSRTLRKLRSVRSPGANQCTAKPLKPAERHKELTIEEGYQAARLCDEAKADEILITQRVATAVGDLIEGEALGESAPGMRREEDKIPDD